MVGYTYNPWLTRTWQTSFQETWKAALPPSLRFQNPFYFSSLPFRPPPPTSVPSRPEPLQHCYGNCLCKLGSSVVSEVEDEAAYDRHVGLDPRGCFWAGPGELLGVFSMVAWFLLALLTFTLWTYKYPSFKDLDICERVEESNLSYVNWVEL